MNITKPQSFYLVILREDSLPPIQWRLVRVTKLHPGTNGSVRVVTVRSSSGQEFRHSLANCIATDTKR